MEKHKQSHKKVRWIPGVFITTGIVVMLISFLIYVLKEATFSPALGQYVAVKNPTADASLVIILGSFVIIGVILVSVGIFSWGRE
jgi:hypothetical protein